LVEETFGALYQKTGEDILKLLKEINEAGRTVIIITHDSKVASHCKRKIVIQDGNIVEDAS
jgi:putative ABC transport system ATP-binding protein